MSCVQTYPYPNGFDPNTALEMLPLVGYMYAQYYTAVYGAVSSWPQSAQTSYATYVSLPSGWTLLSTYQVNEGTTKSPNNVPIGGWVQNGSDYVLAFRGTASHMEWLDDALFAQSNVTGIPGCIHGGFAGVYEILSPALSIPSGATNITITGHSLGGALAELAAYSLASNNPTVYTFGCPLVGNADWANGFNSAVANNYRVTEAWDFIPNEPPVMVAPLINSMQYLYQQTGGQCPVYSSFTDFITAAAGGDYWYGHHLSTYATGLQNLIKAQTPRMFVEVPAA